MVPKRMQCLQVHERSVVDMACPLDVPVIQVTYHSNFSKVESSNIIVIIM